MIMNMKKQIQAAVLAALAAAWIFSAPAAHGQQYATWTAEEGGSFTDPGNWEWDGTPPPDGNHRTYYTATGAYTIAFDQNWEVGSILLVQGADDVDITFQLNENILDLGWTGTPIAVSSSATADRTLRLLNGTVNHQSYLLPVGTGYSTTSNDGESRLVIGNNATLNSAGRASDSVLTYEVGRGNYNGTVEIQSGGRWNVTGNNSFSNNHVTFGIHDDTESEYDPVGTLLIDGGIADFRAGGVGTQTNLHIAYNAGTGNLIVRNEGQLLGPRFLFVATNAAHENAEVPVAGHILVESDGKIETAGGLRLGGTGTTPGGDEATLTIRSGGQVRFLTGDNRESRFFGNSALEIDGGTFYSEQDVEIWAGATYALTLHDKTATPFDAAQAKVELRGNGNGDGVTFELGNMAYGSYWADFKEGDFFTVLLYGSEADLDGEFVNYKDGDSVFTPDGEWKFLMRYAYNPTGELGDSGYDQNDYRIALELATIPEPHTMGLILLGLGAMALRRRLRQNA